MTMFFVLIIIGAGPDSLWSTEYKYVQQGLELLNLKTEDLGYDKQWIPDNFRLRVVSDLMNQPLSVPDYVLGSGRELKKFTKAAEYLVFTNRELTGKSMSPDAITGKTLEAAVRNIFSKTEAHLIKAFQKLTPAQRDSLIFTAPALWSDEADSLIKGNAGALQKEFGDPYNIKDTLKMVDLLRLSRMVDIAELHCAGATLVQGVEGLASMLTELFKSNKPESLQVDGVKGDVYAVIELSNNRKVVIGGPGRNLYTGDFAGIIDLGGNDVYEGRAGAP